MPLFKFLAAQARKPSGLIGRLLMGRLFNWSNDEINTHTVEALDVQRTDQVLDVGFGGGRALEQMVSSVDGGRIVGVDLSDTMVEQARQRFQASIQSGTLEVLQADVMDLPLESDTFDKACTVNTIYFWPDPAACLREIRRVMKDGGRLVVAFRSRDKMENLPIAQHGFTLYAPDEVRALLEQAGFHDAHIDHRNQDEKLDSVLAVATA